MAKLYPDIDRLSIGAEQIAVVTEGGRARLATTTQQRGFGGIRIRSDREIGRCLRAICPLATKATLRVAEPASEVDGVWTTIDVEACSARSSGLFRLRSPPGPVAAAPASLPATGARDWETYQAAAPHKAFAVSLTGGYGSRTAQRTAAEARTAAIEACKRADCKVLAVDDKPVP